MKKFNDYRKFWKEVFIANLFLSDYAQNKPSNIVDRAEDIANLAVLKLIELDKHA